MDVNRLAKLKSEIQKPLLNLFGEPRTCGKAADEKCKLPTISLGVVLEYQGIQTELIGRRRLKLSLMESTVV